MKTISSTNNVDIVVDKDFDYEKSIRVRSDGYASLTVNRKEVLLHRYIMNAQKGDLIDHINGNKLDNRKCNLRFADKSTNAGNMKPKKGYYRHSNGRYAVQFRKVHIGMFDTPEEASRAYQEAHKEYFGEFSRYSV